MLEKCQICGFSWDNNDAYTRRQHRELCQKVTKIIRKFGDYWHYAQREKIKRESWAVVDDESRLISERIAACKKILQAYFYRDISELDFNIKHMPFNKWAGSFLQTEPSIFPSELYKTLVRMYPGRARRRKVS